jgi:hypothetical protein
VTAIVRTIREGIETKQAGGFVIERGHPIPKRPDVLGALTALEVGESFVHDRFVHFGRFRDRLPGRRFVSKEIEPGKWRVWRSA